MTTKVYGASDDLVEVEGDVVGEVPFNNCLLILSDGSMLAVKYAPDGLAIWRITIIVRGTLLQGVEQCEVETNDNYSDIARFADGLTWAYAAREWEKVT